MTPSSPVTVPDPLSCHNHEDWQTLGPALLNAVPIPMFVVDASGTVSIANRMARTDCDLAPGARIESVLPALWQPLSDVLGNRENHTSIALTRSGAPFLARISRINWQSRLIGALCVLDDVTQLEQTTVKLASFQALSRALDTIIDASTDGLWICDGDAVVLRLNPASERINQVRAGEVVGRSMRDLQAEGFVDRSVTLEVLQTRGKVSLMQRTRGNRKLMLTGTPVFDDQGKIVRVVVTEHDITEIDLLRRQLEEQEAIREQFRHQMLEMQMSAIASHQIVAKSPSFIRVLQQALRLGRVDSTVLILGESGTGKGVVANLIHKHSSRADMPLIKLNCGAIPESLVESELFGYEKGAFTGAAQGGKPGHMELAHQGILFLDEIGELPLSAQVKLLRFLEDGHLFRIGATRPRKVDVRVLCATHRDLEAMVANGQFRQDLYYRLNVIPLRIPPLRERRECILPLLQHYMDHFGKKHGRQAPARLSTQATDAMLSYGYPGNVRELINICERLVVMTDAPEIQLEELPSAVRNCGTAAWPALALEPLEGMALPEMLAAVEKKILLDARERHQTQWEMAKALGVDQSTIARKLRRHGLLDAPLCKTA